MNIYQELIIEGKPEDLKRFLAEAQAVDHGWERDQEQEANLGKEYVAFRKPETSHLPAAVLYLYGEPPEGRYQVANILPTDKNELSLQEYNRLTRSFYETCVQPYQDSYQLKATLTAEDTNFAETVSPPTFELLKRFSALANKSTGSSHPADRRRWLDFVASSIKNHDKIDTGLLSQWLVDEEQWPKEEASRLIRDYELAVDLQNLVAA
ncbi:MAG: hypothetical protein M3Y13_00640 [Armatimonadota bacterium]|nr:hypothetical protein [Armatimonadota bacterium]